MDLNTREGGTQSIGRSVIILRTIALQGKKGMSITQIVQMSGLTKTTCARMLARLDAEGLVQKDSRSKRYYLGPLLYEMGLLAQPRYLLSQLCDESIQRLAAKSEDTVYLSERSGLDAVCTSCVLGDHPIKVVPLDCGVRRPLGVAIGGTAILASMDPSEAKNIITAIGSRYERYEGLSECAVMANVLESRERGYVSGPSYGANEAISIAVGFPVERPIGAISVSALRNRMTNERQQLISEWIRHEIKLITRKIEDGFLLGTKHDIANR